MDLTSFLTLLIRSKYGGWIVGHTVKSDLIWSLNTISEIKEILYDVSQMSCLRRHTIRKHDQYGLQNIPFFFLTLGKVKPNIFYLF